MPSIYSSFSCAHTHTHTHTPPSFQTTGRAPRRSIKQKGVSVATQTVDTMPRPHLPPSLTRRKKLQQTYCLQHFRNHELEEFLRRAPPPVPPSMPPENADSESQDEAPVQKKSVWLSASDPESCSRCIEVRPHVRNSDLLHTSHFSY